LHRECPYCGFYPEPVARTKPEYVDGDLAELDAETLARMRGDIAQIDEPIETFAQRLFHRHIPVEGHTRMIRLHAAKQEAQRQLRDAIATWATDVPNDSEGHRRFYFRFGTDVLTAQALGTTDAAALTEAIRRDTE